MASYETIKMHPSCNTSYKGEGSKGSQGTYGHCVLCVSVRCLQIVVLERKLLSIIFSQIY